MWWWAGRAGQRAGARQRYGLQRGAPGDRIRDAPDLPHQPVHGRRPAKPERRNHLFLKCLRDAHHLPHHLGRVCVYLHDCWLQPGASQHSCWHPLHAI